MTQTHRKCCRCFILLLREVYKKKKKSLRFVVRIIPKELDRAWRSISEQGEGRLSGKQANADKLAVEIHPALQFAPASLLVHVLLDF